MPSGTLLLGHCSTLAAGPAPSFPTLQLLQALLDPAFLSHLRPLAHSLCARGPVSSFRTISSRRDCSVLVPAGRVWGACAFSRLELCSAILVPRSCPPFHPASSLHSAQHHTPLTVALTPALAVLSLLETHGQETYLCCLLQYPGICSLKQALNKLLRNT